MIAYFNCIRNMTRVAFYYNKIKAIVLIFVSLEQSKWLTAKWLEATREKSVVEFLYVEMKVLF
jgi:hypothetical protein